MDRRAVKAQRRMLATAGVLLLSACGTGEGQGGADDLYTSDVIALMVSGTVSGDPPSIEFEPNLRRATGEQHEVEPGPWTLTIDTNDGSLDVPFDITDEIDDDHPSARFSVAMQPAPAGVIRRMSVTLDGDEIGAVDGNDTIPSITIMNPIQGTTVPVDELVIEWSSDDPDAVATAYLSLDDGTSWTPISDWTSDSTIRVAPDAVAPTDEARVELAVSDGVNAVAIRTGPFTLIAAAD